MTPVITVHDLCQLTEEMTPIIDCNACGANRAFRK
jgi:hypothetical protein